MIKKIILLLNALLLVSLIYPQIPNQTDQKIVDSLFLLLPEAKGNAKVDILNQLALNLAPRSYDSSYQFASEALHLSEELDYQKGKGIAIFNIGNSYYFTADYKSALLNYLKALRILETFEPQKELADLLLSLGALNQYVNNLETARSYFLRSAGNYSKIGDKSGMVMSYIMMGVTFSHKFLILWPDTLVQKENRPLQDSAIKYVEIARDCCLIHNPQIKWSKKEYYLYTSYNLLGQFYSNKSGQNEKYCDSLSLSYSFKALELANEMINPEEKKDCAGRTLLNICGYYYGKDSFLSKGLEYARLSEVHLRESDLLDQYSMLLDYFGLIELEKGNYAKARYYLELGLSKSDTFLVHIDRIKTQNPFYRLVGFTNMMRGRLYLFYDLVEVNQLTGNFEKALFYQKKLDEERKKISMDEMNRLMTGLQVNFEDELQHQQIELATQEKELARLKLNRSRVWFAGAGSAAVIAFLIILLYLQRKKYSTEQNALLLKQRLLRSQMNPHFIFNSLSGIQNFIVTEKPTKASIYLSKFATLVRNILDSSVREYITLEKEVSTIENYLELQKVRYAGKFEFTIRVDDALDPETTMIPPMLAQPFIENAIEHGIVHSDKAGQIDVEFRLENDVILFEVRDNGVGREKARELEAGFEKDHSSMSTAITLERLAMLNKKRKHKIIFEITDIKDAEANPAGTLVKFGIPLRH